MECVLAPFAHPGGHLANSAAPTLQSRSPQEPPALQIKPQPELDCKPRTPQTSPHPFVGDQPQAVELKPGPGAGCDPSLVPLSAAQVLVPGVRAAAGGILPRADIGGVSSLEPQPSPAFAHNAPFAAANLPAGLQPIAPAGPGSLTALARPFQSALALPLDPALGQDGPHRDVLGRADPELYQSHFEGKPRRNSDEPSSALEPSSTSSRSLSSGESKPVHLEHPAPEDQFDPGPVLPAVRIKSAKKPRSSISSKECTPRKSPARMKPPEQLAAEALIEQQNPNATKHQLRSLKLRALHATRIAEREKELSGPERARRLRLREYVRKKREEARQRKALGAANGQPLPQVAKLPGKAHAKGTGVEAVANGQGLSSRTKRPEKPHPKVKGARNGCSSSSPLAAHANQASREGITLVSGQSQCPLGPSRTSREWTQQGTTDFGSDYQHDQTVTSSLVAVSKQDSYPQKLAMPQLASSHMTFPGEVPALGPVLPRSPAKEAGESVGPESMGQASIVPPCDSMVHKAVGQPSQVKRRKSATDSPIDRPKPARKRAVTRVKTPEQISLEALIEQQHPNATRNQLKSLKLRALHASRIAEREQNLSDKEKARRLKLREYMRRRRDEERAEKGELPLDPNSTLKVCLLATRAGQPPHPEPVVCARTDINTSAPHGSSPEFCPSTELNAADRLAAFSMMELNSNFQHHQFAHSQSSTPAQTRPNIHLHPIFQFPLSESPSVAPELNGVVHPSYDVNRPLNQVEQRNPDMVNAEQQSQDVLHTALEKAIRMDGPKVTSAASVQSQTQTLPHNVGVAEYSQERGESLVRMEEDKIIVPEEEIMGVERARTAVSGEVAMIAAAAAEVERAQGLTLGAQKV